MDQSVACLNDSCYLEMATLLISSTGRYFMIMLYLRMSAHWNSAELINDASYATSHKYSNTAAMSTSRSWWCKVEQEYHWLRRLVQCDHQRALKIMVVNQATSLTSTNSTTIINEQRLISTRNEFGCQFQVIKSSYWFDTTSTIAIVHLNMRRMLVITTSSWALWRWNHVSSASMHLEINHSNGDSIDRQVLWLVADRMRMIWLNDCIDKVIRMSKQVFWS